MGSVRQCWYQRGVRGHRGRPWGQNKALDGLPKCQFNWVEFGVPTSSLTLVQHSMAITFHLLIIYITTIVAILIDCNSTGTRSLHHRICFPGMLCFTELICWSCHKKPSQKSWWRRERGDCVTKSYRLQRVRRWGEKSGLEWLGSRVFLMAASALYSTLLRWLPGGSAGR